MVEPRANASVDADAEAGAGTRTDIRADAGFPRDLVLIHGAWQGAWAFDAWLPHLRAAGWRPHALDLPGNGHGPDAAAPASLDSYVAAVRRRLDAPDLAGRRVVLVGHSGGGLTATQTAEAVPERIAALVYLAGMMLPSGGSFADVVRDCAAADPARGYDGIAPWLDWNADRSASRVRTEGALEIFLHDCDPAAARAAAAKLGWQPETGRAMRPRWTPERHGRLPRIYVECTADRSLLLPTQRRMQALVPGALRISLDCGHVPQLVRPAELTARLGAALDQVFSSQTQLRESA
ncbi:alpha/beta fold hydrolase [Derxia gummosa]|uniref:Alpha/beta fold hydrolase n=1 Tax=Derxia gummosa DSM 723 TaxID=1121388 RepID=A0A8B6XB31_9BURK|nr:alpha/beta hydrolase [Derxia gummosa]